MSEEAVETGANTAPVQTVPRDPGSEAEPPPEEPPARSSANLYTLLGLGFALLAGGAYFFLFLRPAQLRALEEVARFTAVEGEVKVKPSATQQWTPAATKMILRSQDVVQTAPRAGAALAFKTGSVLRLQPDSVVLIGESVDTSEEALRLQSGQANFEAARATSIVTGTATTRASANSEGNISIDEGGGTGIQIFKGSAEVATLSGDKLTLLENEAVKVDALGKAGRKLSLPVAPRQIAPPSAAELAYRKGPEATVRLEWQPVPGGATYRVAMDYNVVQADLLLSAALDEPGIGGSHHDLRDLDPGEYYWRVAGVNEEGVAGKYSRVSSFAVVQKAEAPPTPAPAAVRIDALEALGAVVALRGRVAPGSTVSVEGSPIDVEPDGSFSEFLKGLGRRELTIRVTAPDGTVTEVKRPVS
jgi:hypothetical protein